MLCEATQAKFVRKVNSYKVTSGFSQVYGNSECDFANCARINFKM